MGLTKEEVRKRFEYRDGDLYYRRDTRYKKAGEKAGVLDSGGYVHIKLNGKSYRAHRLIYLYHYGYMPKELDHINRNKADNRIENLREATSSQNHANSEKRKGSNSRFKGVFCCKNTIKRPWQALMTINGHNKYLGVFTTEEEAARAYDRAAIEAWGDYAYTNEDAGLYAQSEADK